jgi:hypothetical protein
VLEQEVALGHRSGAFGQYPRPKIVAQRDDRPGDQIVDIVSKNTLFRHYGKDVR